MKPPINKKKISQTIEAHAQKYQKSCSPSLIEIMLKINELVGPEFYELQDRYQNENVGLVHFEGQAINGLRVDKHSPDKGTAFIERLREAWKNGEVIGLYCRNKDGCGCHGWIVEDLTEHQICLISKYSENGEGLGRVTARETFPLQGPGSIQITDLIVGRIEELESPKKNGL